MKVIENVTLYRCDFCNKELKRKHAMEKHEKHCDRNPDVKKDCFECENLESIEKDVWFDGYYGEDGFYKKVKVFRCKKLEQLMFPHSIEKRDLHNKYPDTFEGQYPMPNKCDDFEKIIEENFNIFD